MYLDPYRPPWIITKKAYEDLTSASTLEYNIVLSLIIQIYHYPYPVYSEVTLVAPFLITNWSVLVRYSLSSLA